ncbi:hypothetical protein ACTMM2_14380, partial [Escherichia coli]
SDLFNKAVSTWMAPFQNDMYSEDNPISPYYKIEW